MDCSNPVKDSTRVTLDRMQKGTRMLKRQDLHYLETLVKSTQRTVLRSLPVIAEDKKLISQRLAQVMSSIPKPPPIDRRQLGELDFLDLIGPVDLCNITYKGYAIHPSGVNQKGGKVATMRQWGGFKPDEFAVTSVLRYLEPEEVSAGLSRVAYTYGTPEGFKNRLKELTTRKCKSIFGVHHHQLGIKSTIPELLALMRHRMPVDVSRLSNWHVDINDRVDQVKTSNISSAGFPYCVAKPEALDAMREVLLPETVARIADGTVFQWLNQNPELGLVECKNKLDRYEYKKLNDKCRPYFALPFHFQVLFSALCQEFCGALNVFHERVGCANAYGFSWAHGGATKYAQFMGEAQEVKDADPRFVVYGDDVDIFFKRDGVLYRISPDFRQMDGSVDKDCVDLTITYILDVYRSVYGPNPFWEQVGAVWSFFATAAPFIVEGTNVYKKKKSDGLLSGAVGTTLFDTVKAMLSYDRFCSLVHERARKGDYTMLEANSPATTKWFRDVCGLEVKEGTWIPERVNLMPNNHCEISSNKFLGMRLMVHYEDNEPVYLPTLRTPEWTELLLVSKNDPLEDPHKNLGRQRLLFDRLRGYLTTGAIFDRNSRLLMHGIINDLPGLPIVMAVQSNGGKGLSPDAAWLSEDFAFPTSEGVPTIEWALSLYLEAEADPAFFKRLFPELRDVLDDFRNQEGLRKPLLPQISETTEGFRSVLFAEDTETVLEVPELEPRMLTAKTTVGPAKLEKLKQLPSKIPVKRPVPQIEFIQTAASRMGLNVKQATDRLKQEGAYVHDGLVSLTPILNSTKHSDIEQLNNLSKTREVKDIAVVPEPFDWGEEPLPPLEPVDLSDVRGDLAKAAKFLNRNGYAPGKYRADYRTYHTLVPLISENGVIKGKNVDDEKVVYWTTAPYKESFVMFTNFILHVNDRLSGRKPKKAEPVVKERSTVSEWYQATKPVGPELVDTWSRELVAVGPYKFLFHLKHSDWYVDRHSNTYDYLRLLGFVEASEPSLELALIYEGRPRNYVEADLRELLIAAQRRVKADGNDLWRALRESSGISSMSSSSDERPFKNSSKYGKKKNYTSAYRNTKKKWDAKSHSRSTSESPQSGKNPRGRLY